MARGSAYLAPPLTAAIERIRGKHASSLEDTSCALTSARTREDAGEALEPQDGERRGYVMDGERRGFVMDGERRGYAMHRRAEGNGASSGAGRLGGFLGCDDRRTNESGRILS